MTIRIGLLLASALAVSGCAGVSVQALSPDGQHAVGAAGLRYYLPRPYLLVTAAPANVAEAAPSEKLRIVDPDDSGAATSAEKRPGDRGSDRSSTSPASHSRSQLPPPPSQGGPPAQGSSRAGAGGGGSEQDKGDKSKSSSSDSQGASGPASDTSFQHLVGSYQVELIYLPDLSRPMSITMSSGLFGTASSQPTLVDGWMLTSLQGSSDSKAAETLGALASIISSAEGGGAAKAAAKAGAGDDGPAPRDRPVQPRGILGPGLYAFDYDGKSGLLTRVCAVTLFSDAKPGATSPTMCDRSQTASANEAWTYAKSHGGAQ